MTDQTETTKEHSNECPDFEKKARSIFRNVYGIQRVMLHHHTKVAILRAALENVWIDGQQNGWRE